MPAQWIKVDCLWLLFLDWLLHNGRGCSWSIDDDHNQIEVTDHSVTLPAVTAKYVTVAVVTHSLSVASISRARSGHMLL